MSKRWFGMIFVLAGLVFAASVFDQLPERIATHFNAVGEPDGWSTRWVGAFGLPIFAAAMVAVFNVVPNILPRRKNFEQFEATYWLICNLVVAFLFALHVVILGRALGWPIDIATTMLLGVGLLFVVLGNVMPRTRSNWFMGIRTPWTLDSEHVWRVTHRLGGRTMMVGGLITMAAAFMPARVQPWVGFGALALGAFVPVIYSYIAWRREKQSRA
jgi:uncharacterized membrane protein